MKRDEWFAFNVGHYVRDTMHLTTEQHGAYLLLILAYWPHGPLPDDDQVLASIAKQPLPAWRRMRPTIQAFFQPANGKWNHKRIDKERMKAIAIGELRSTAGKESARQKAIKRATHVEPVEKQTTTQLHKQRQTSPSIQSVSEGASVEDARPRHPDERPMTAAGEAAQKLMKDLVRKVAAQ